jgi:hypothetical protein
MMADIPGKKENNTICIYTGMNKSECHAPQLFPLSLQGDIENAQRAMQQKGKSGRGCLLLPH